MRNPLPHLRSTASRAATLAALALFAGIVMPTLSATPASSAPTVAADITKFTYAPKDITIAPGTKVVWTNKDETPHTVTSNDKSFASKGLDTDDKFEHTFAAVGDFDYICTVHPFMTGTVHVRKP
jgi:plastocyanin